MAAIEQPAIEKVFQRPPHALDVTLVIGDIGLVQVNPKAQPLGEPLPFLHVPPDALLAFDDKPFDAVIFDLFLAVNPQLFANLDLDRQPVGVPAGLPLAAVTPHRAVARKQVFDGPGEAMPGMRHSVGGRRAFVKDKRRGAFAPLERFLVDAALAPKPADAALKLGEIDVTFNRVEHKCEV